MRQIKREVLIEIDDEGQSVYIYLDTKRINVADVVQHSVPIGSGSVIDIDAQGKAVGIELLEADIFF